MASDKQLHSTYPPGDEWDPELWHAEDDEPVDERESGDDGDDDQPEPDEDVDLLVDDVEGQDAEAVFLLHSTGGTIVVERALGHLGKDLGHGIGPVFGLHLGVGQHLEAIVPKLVAKEEVSEVDMTEDIGKVKDFAEEEPDGVEAVSSPVEAPVADDVVNLALLTLSADDGFLVK